MRIGVVAPKLAFAGILGLAMGSSNAAIAGADGAPGAAGNSAGSKPAWTETPGGTTTYFAPSMPFAAKPDAAAPAAAPSATIETTAAIATAADPIVEAAGRALADKAVTGRADKDDVDALKAFLARQPKALWIKAGAFTSDAKAVIDEIRKADDWGLRASDFDLPELQSGAAPDALGQAEAKLSLAALKYARYARGGRVEPLSISNIWDMKPPVKEPGEVISALSQSSTPAKYLVSLHPKHEGFVKLREALLKARGPQVEEKIDEALKVKLPEGKTIKPGEENADISLLRKRLKIEAQSPSNETLYDARLEAAIRAFQEDKGLKANGRLDARTRKALNAEGEPKKSDPRSSQDRIIANMERWRWLPEDLGSLHVMNNIPEFMGRVVKDGRNVWEEKIIIGQPTWPTPILTSSMQFIVFKPEWGVPDGIKMKELLPRLKRAGGGGGFFDQLFGGGSSGGARVLAAYGLKPSYNGRPIDANDVDWNRVDIRQFSFVQPAGAQNPLGEVKFRFPNRHDVYMHDTTQRALFAQSFRALSHGCIRVQNPRKLAEVLLGEDKGWSENRVSAMFSSGGEVTLEKPVQVYLTYFTARVDGDGKLRTFSDLYGHDGRLLSALAGRPVRYEAPEASSSEDVMADAGDSDYVPAAAPSTRKKDPAIKKGSQPQRRRGDTAGDILTNALSGLVAN